MAVLYENVTYLYHYYGKMSLFRLNRSTYLCSKPSQSASENESGQETILENLQENVLENLNGNTVQTNNESQNSAIESRVLERPEKSPNFCVHEKSDIPILWFISNDYYDQLKFRIFARLSLNPSYAPDPDACSKLNGH